MIAIIAWIVQHAALCWVALVTTIVMMVILREQEHLNQRYKRDMLALNERIRLIEVPGEPAHPVTQQVVSTFTVPLAQLQSAGGPTTPIALPADLHVRKKG